MTWLLERPWWSRVWIIQELCLAREVLVACGESTAPWEAVAFAVANLHKLPDDSFALASLSATGKYRSLANTRFHISRSKPDTCLQLVDALAAFRWSQATNPRDKVYALLGLTNDVNITPEYGESVESCYEETARCIISKSGNLDVLDFVVPAYHLPRQQCTYILPSWVPDWTRHEEDSSGHRGVLGELSRTSFSLYYDMVRDEKEPLLQSAARFPSEGLLVWKGMIVDCLLNVQEVVQLAEFPAPSPATITSNKAARLLSLCLFVFRTCRQAVRTVRVLVRFLIDRASFVDAVERDIISRDPGIDRHNARFQAVERLLDLLARDIAKPEPVADTAREFLEMQDEINRPILVRLAQRLKLPRYLPSLYGYLLFFLTIVLGDPDDEREDFDHLPLEVGRRPAITRDGRLCFAPHTCCISDQVALLRGGRHPYVIRKAGDEWEVVGPCYVSNKDMAELRKLWDDRDAVEMTFK